MKSKNIILLFTLALPLFSCSESQKRVSFSESTTAKSTALKEAFLHSNGYKKERRYLICR